MRISRAFLALALLLPATAGAQNGNTAAAVRDELLLQFEVSMQKFIALAEEMPADRFTWKPQKDAMEVGHVYAHVANYNYSYPSTAMGIAAPAALKLDTLERMRDKAQLVAHMNEHLGQSIAYARANEIVPPWSR